MELKSEADFEVVVVDNNCTDNSKQVTQTFGEHIKYVFEKRTSFSRARNTGAQNASGDILIYIDDDVLLRPGTFKGLTEIFASHPECGMVAGKIDPKFTQSPPPWTLACNNVFNGWSLYNPQTIQFVKNSFCEVPWAAGPMMAVRTEIFDKVGGFPPDTIGVETNVQKGTFRKLYVGNGDIGLSEKIRAAGFKIYAHPDISCFHVIPPIRYTIGFWRSRMIGEGHAMAVTERGFYHKSDGQLFIERKRIQIRYLGALQKLLAGIRNLTNNPHTGGLDFDGMLPDELWVRYCAAYLELDQVLRRHPGLGMYLWNLGAEGVADKDFKEVMNRLPEDYLNLIGRDVFANPNPVNSMAAVELIRSDLPPDIKAECEISQTIIRKVERYCRELPKTKKNLGIYAFFDDTDKNAAIRLLKSIDLDQTIQKAVQEWLTALGDSSILGQGATMISDEAAPAASIQPVGGTMDVGKMKDNVSQTQLYLHYQLLRNMKLPLPKFEDTGFRVYSQNDEDGLLLYIFSLIGSTNKICVDVGSGTPYGGGNTANLILNWGWGGLLIEGNEKAVEQTTQFYASHPDTWIYPPKAINAYVTAENINNLIQGNGFSGEVDLFCLDLDGVDYWILKALNVIQPRVILVEYMNVFDSEQAVTVPYRPDFNRFDTHPDFFGASLSAFVKLGRKKGYRLVGCNRYGFNAFFIRSGIGEDVLPEITPAQCLKHPQAVDGNKNRLPQVINYDWVEV